MADVRLEPYERMAAGASFDVEINRIVLASGGERGVFFLRNDSTTHNLVLWHHYVSWIDKTGGPPQSDAANFRLIHNPTGGTLLQAGLAVIPRNRLSDSPNVAPNKLVGGVSAFHSARGNETILGGETFFTQEFPTAYPVFINPLDIDYILQPGGTNSLAYAYTPPNGILTVTMSLAIQFYYVPASRPGDFARLPLT